MTESTAPDEHDRNLEWLSLDGESVLWAGGPDRRTIAPTAILLILPVLALGVVPFNTIAGLAIAGFLGLLTVPVVAWAVLRVRNTDYVVTSSGLYAKHGVLSRDVKRIDFEKVQNTSYSQSALGARFGYGHVEVSSAGGSGVEMRFNSVPNPREIQQLISSRVSRDRNSDRPTTPPAERSTDEILEEILTELRAIRSSLKGESEGRREGTVRSRAGSKPEPGLESESQSGSPTGSQSNASTDEDVTLEHESPD
ncbi:PH domain-containing protein [Natronorubrum sp. JWXQ-INN-674]|uniref:PH domain-containing protein n=1 Tax=Natronorubrum halalkaliphilum TaxID=2691917 RepID=A0A6B0VQV3_9EURY|nr:PH domain-containing protein [Natronorubrum halalkaliphilum]MXV64181.1 PH domain-containing protein [Natronorubrum halalkaliphilum]